MKSSKSCTNLFLLLVIVLLFACDKIVIIGPRTSPDVPVRGGNPRTPIALGTIRGNFGGKYRVFSQHIERVAPIDSFSNCYFYGSCNGTTSNQINLIRCDSDFVAAIYINGYPLDSLPPSGSEPYEYGRHVEIQFYPFYGWNSTSPEHYALFGVYGTNITITDRTDDILTGTFKGAMESSAGSYMTVTDGEFKIKIFRKDMSCGR